MKTLMIGLLFLSGTAFANAPAESISLICNGRQMIPGGSVSAPVTIKASTKGNYVNPPWSIDVSWAIEKTPIVGAGIACGVTLPKDTECYESRGSSGFFSLTRECGPRINNGGVPHQQYSEQIVISGDHGYFNCSGSKAHHIQLFGCKNQP